MNNGTKHYMGDTPQTFVAVRVISVESFAYGRLALIDHPTEGLIRVPYSRLVKA